MRHVELSRALLKLAQRLERAQAKSNAAGEARFALPAGSSRARVTTANARWMRAAEERDRCAKAFHELAQQIVFEVGQ